MKLHVLSDLHMEGRPYTLPDVEADALVLAGDINQLRNGIGTVQSWAQNRPVIYVPGNHEFYHTWHGEALADAKSHAKGDLHFLENEEVIVGDVRFLGCTLWTDFALNGDPIRGRRDAEEWMNDYSVIHKDNHLLIPRDVWDIHMQSKSWLTLKLLDDWKGKTVVVTHHLPSPQSIDPAFAGAETNPAFASDLRYMFPFVDLWIHGHTHKAVDYQDGRCRVVCNPRGYSKEVSGYDPKLVVEV